MKVFSCHAVSIVMCKVVCFFSLWMAMKKNVTIGRDDLKATEQNYLVVLWNVVPTFESFESI